MKQKHRIQAFRYGVTAHATLLYLQCHWPDYEHVVRDTSWGYELWTVCTESDRDVLRTVAAAFADGWGRGYHCAADEREGVVR